MLRELRIANFKGWQDTGPITMAPITLFFGANSSGKSSIGQFLMMLKQTVESSDRKAVFYPGGKNSAVQLGSYQDMVFHRNLANNIAFHYRWDLPNTLEFKDSSTGRTYAGDRLSFDASVGVGENFDQRQLILDRLAYQIMERDRLVLDISMDRHLRTKGEYLVTTDGYTLKTAQARLKNPGVPVRFYGFPDEVVAYFQNAVFVQNLNLEHEKFFRSLFYFSTLAIFCVAYRFCLR